MPHNLAQFSRITQNNNYGFYQVRPCNILITDDINDRPSIYVDVTRKIKTFDNCHSSTLVMNSTIRSDVSKLQAITVMLPKGSRSPVAINYWWNPETRRYGIVVNARRNIFHLFYCAGLVEDRDPYSLGTL